MMGYQPTIRPELLHPPGNPNVYCGECSAKIEDGLSPCPKCGTLFPLMPPISPYTEFVCEWCRKPFTAVTHVHEIAPHRYCSSECYDANHRESIEQWNMKLLQASAKPASLYTPEPTYGVLIEDFMLALGTFLLTLWHALVGKRNSRVPLIQLPPQSMDTSWDLGVDPIGEDGTYYPSAQMLTAGKVTTIEAINNMRAIHGYESLPDEPHADHQEMQFAPVDWRSEN